MQAWPRVFASGCSDATELQAVPKATAIGTKSVPKGEDIPQGTGVDPRWSFKSSVLIDARPGFYCLDVPHVRAKTQLKTLRKIKSSEEIMYTYHAPDIYTR